jgi:hypothetical protein
MDEYVSEYKGYDRHFLIGGILNGGTFSITLVSRRHFSVADVYQYFTSQGVGILEIQILSVYEFRDLEDYNDFKAVANEQQD